MNRSIGKTPPFSRKGRLGIAVFVIFFTALYIGGFATAADHFRIFTADKTFRDIHVRDVLTVDKKTTARTDGKVPLGTYLVQRVTTQGEDQLMVIDLEHPTGNSPFTILYTDIYDSYKNLNFRVLQPGDVGYNETLKKFGDT